MKDLIRCPAKLSGFTPSSEYGKLDDWVWLFRFFSFIFFLPFLPHKSLWIDPFSEYGLKCVCAQLIGNTCGLMGRFFESHTTQYTSAMSDRCFIELGTYQMFKSFFSFLIFPNSNIIRIFEATLQWYIFVWKLIFFLKIGCGTPNGFCNPSSVAFWMLFKVRWVAAHISGA